MVVESRSEKMRKSRGGWGETGRRPVSPQPPRIFPAATTPFPKSRASYFRFARFNTSPLYYLRAWHRLVKNGTENYISQIPGNIRITELQKIVLLGTAHTLRRSLSITVIHESYDCPKFMEWTRLHKRKEHESNFSPTSQTFLLYCWSSSVDMWSSMNLYRARLPTYR